MARIGLLPRVRCLRSLINANTPRRIFPWRPCADATVARKLLEQVLQASVRLLGKEHPDTLRAMPGSDVGSSAAARRIKNDQQFLEIMWELFPRFRKVPEQENPIMIGENDSDEIRTMVYS